MAALEESVLATQELVGVAVTPCVSSADNRYALELESG
jgi:hypothetical protein